MSHGGRSLPKAVPAPPKDWEDEFHRLQDKHNELKGMYNESVEHNRKLQAQIRKLHSEAAQLTGGGGGPLLPQSKEDEQLVSKLYQENSKLKASNTAIKEKNKALLEILEKKKRELALAVKKNMSLKSASVGELPAARGASIAQDIDIKPAPTSRKLGGSVSRPSAPQPGVAPAPECPVCASGGSNDKMVHLARDYKVRLVNSSSA